MFDQIKNMASLMKNAGAIREKAERFKAELERKTIEGSSGGGAVRVTLNGKGRTLRVHVEPALLAGLAGGDRLMVEELIAAAFNDAHDKLQELIASELRKVTGDMDLPGLQNMLGQ